MVEAEKSVDLSQPKWDQSNYLGRARHFFSATNPMNLFVTPASLDDAKNLVQRHKSVLVFDTLVYSLLLT